MDRFAAGEQGLWQILQQTLLYLSHARRCFRSQGASGDFSSSFERSPRNSDEEKEIEDPTGVGRDKGRADTETSNDDVIKVRQHKGKGKKGKGKCKSGDLSGDLPIPSPSATAHDRYYHVLDGLESLVSQKKSSNNSISVSVGSPSKSQPVSSKAKSAYEVALEQLSNLQLPWEVHDRMGDILKDKQEQLLWFTTRCDEDRISLVRMLGCFPSNPWENQTRSQSLK